MYDDRTVYRTVRDVEGAPTFGYSALVERRAPRGNTPLPPIHTETVEIRRKGSRATIDRAAAQVRRAVRVVELWEYDEAAYKRAFGWGRM